MTGWTSLDHCDFRDRQSRADQLVGSAVLSVPLASSVTACRLRIVQERHTQAWLAHSQPVSVQTRRIRRMETRSVLWWHVTTRRNCVLTVASLRLPGANRRGLSDESDQKWVGITLRNVARESHTVMILNNKVRCQDTRYRRRRTWLRISALQSSVPGRRFEASMRHGLAGPSPPSKSTDNAAT